MKLHPEIAQAVCSCCSVVRLLGPSVLSSATNFLLVSSLSFLTTNLLWHQQCSAHCTTALLLRNHFHRSRDHMSFLSHIPRRVSLGNQNACSYRPKSMVTAHIHLQTEKASSLLPDAYLCSHHITSDMPLYDGRCLRFGHISVKSGSNKRERAVQPSGYWAPGCR